jgi:hypothetical protein
MTETATPRTPFPERMHEQAVEINTRRAVHALDSLIERAALLRKRMNDGSPADAISAYDLAEQAMRVGIHLSALETLRETREWDKADRYGDET